MLELECRMVFHEQATCHRGNCPSKVGNIFGKFHKLVKGRSKLGTNCTHFKVSVSCTYHAYHAYLLLAEDIPKLHKVSHHISSLGNFHHRQLEEMLSNLTILSHFSHFPCGMGPKNAYIVSQAIHFLSEHSFSIFNL